MRIFKTFAIVLFLCGISFMTAQQTITGTVLDPDGLPISEADVTVQGTAQTAVTDMDGNFNLEVEDFPATVEASYIGYETATVEVASTDPIEIALSSGISLDEVIATGAKSARSQKQSAMSMTTLKSEEIQRKSASSQADILRSIPGVVAEGGGGEVATNVFVRGLPSGGQYVFNPLEYDGMPVISTFGLNSSAHDVYARNDLGIKSLDFPRGGAAILYGAGSVAGVINYISKTGTNTPENTVQFEWADGGRYKADFFSGGKVGGEDSRTYYAVSGFLRYDEGPIDTGLPTQGFQLRGNIKQEFDRGELILSGQYIDDRAQFYLPLPLNGSNREFATGNDGNEVNTIQTSFAQNLSYATPNGIYRTPIKDGVATKGGYFMANYKHEFENNIKMDAKIRYARYQHQFNLFLTGSGNPQTINDFVADVDASATGIVATNTGTTRALDGDDLVLVNTLLDRNRPMTDMAAEMNLTKKWVGETFEHNVTAGFFLSRTEAWDQNVQTRFLAEFNNQPRMVDLSYTSGGTTHILSQNGLYNPGAAYANNFITANKQAAYLTDEMKIGDRLRVDIGVRVETLNTEVSRENTTTYQMSTDTELSSDLQNVVWGSNSYLTGNASVTDWAGLIAANYKINNSLYVYGNFSKGYFFPQPRSLRIASDGTVGSYNSEKINQTEFGVKYGTRKLQATLASYYVTLKDRVDVVLREDPNTGVIVEEATQQSTRTFGAEATWNYNFMENLSFNGSLTWQNHEYTSHETNPDYEGNELARQPNFMASSGLNFDNKKWDAGFSWNYTGAKFTDDSNNVELDALNIFRLDGGYTMNMGEKETLRLGVSVYNLFDENGLTEGNPRDTTQANSGSTYFVGRPILPRRVFVRATFNF